MTVRIRIGRTRVARLAGPPLSDFTPAERRLIARLKTPDLVQRFLNRLPYNMELPPGPETLRSFRGVVRHRTAHCLEAALGAACILEQHGFPPLVMSLKSIDYLDHVIFVYRKRGCWGSVARSRDPGLHGRKPVFRSPRALAMSYFDPYIDFTGRVTGYAVFDLRRLGRYDWRLSPRNIWAVERALLRYPHKPVKGTRKRIRRFRVRYRQYRAKYNKKPLFYRGREKWTEIPKEFL
jgi:hypothetical protein